MDPFYFLAKRYIAGRTFTEALPAVRRLREEGFLTTIDYVGESVTKQSEADAIVTEYCQILKQLKENNLDVNVSLKLTQLGLDISDDVCFENVNKILITASRLNAFIRIDMEGSPCTQRTIDLVSRCHRIYPYLGAVIQSMLKRSEKDVRHLLDELIPIRLVKGAYKEPETIAFTAKRDVDRNFCKLSEILLSSDLYHAFATHDEKIVNHVKAFCDKKGIGKDKFEFQMLYGIRPSLERKLRDEGYNVRVYIPFGRGWMAYVFRRLRERKENIWFVVRSLFGR